MEKFCLNAWTVHNHKMCIVNFCHTLIFKDRTARRLRCGSCSSLPLSPSFFISAARRSQIVASLCRRSVRLPPALVACALVTSLGYSPPLLATALAPPALRLLQIPPFFWGGFFVGGVSAFAFALRPPRCRGLVNYPPLWLSGYSFRFLGKNYAPPARLWRRSPSPVRRFAPHPC